MKGRQEPHTLTGPDTDVTMPSMGAAISKGQTRASRSSEPCTFYVRNPDGRGVAVIEKHPDRTVTVSRPVFIPGA